MFVIIWHKKIGKMLVKLTVVRYVHSKFVRQEAVGIYYIPWPAKKIAAQNSYTSLSARNSQKLCSLHSQLAKAAKKQTSNKHIIISRSTG